MRQLEARAIVVYAFGGEDIIAVAEDGSAQVLKAQWSPEERSRVTQVLIAELLHLGMSEELTLSEVLAGFEPAIKGA